MSRPNYKKIYNDLIQQKYPEYADQCQAILSREKLSVLDIIRLDSIISKRNKKENKQNQKFRSYDKATVIEILNYQKKHHLTNDELAKHFKLSRNTVAKWKKYFV